MCTFTENNIHYETTKQLLCIGGLLLAGAVAQAQNDPNLIDITTLEQLDAIRYDLDGNGVVDDNRNDQLKLENKYL